MRENALTQWWRKICNATGTSYITFSADIKKTFINFHGDTHRQIAQPHDILENIT